jgi:hypothetical protein
MPSNAGLQVSRYSLQRGWSKRLEVTEMTPVPFLSIFHRLQDSPDPNKGTVPLRREGQSPYSEPG